ncbi:MAG TPA: FxsA family protein [Chromatiales bacterium]|nr:FxsA family protein [Thiotrichales bacterium]HIP68838.1 FxsA family protein [Chromatiales bacterium]
MPLLLLVFIIVPIFELYLLIKVGGIIGALPTVAIVIITAVIGTWLLRQQGLATLQRYQTNLGQGKLPAMELVEGLVLLFGGALLLTPGFFTDAIGFICLIPVTRQALIRRLMKYAKNHIQIRTVHMSEEQGHVYEGKSRHHPDDLLP